jgi:hypothetical protein
LEVYTIESSLAKARAAKASGGLFANRSFYVLYKNGPDLPPVNEIKDLTRASGGKVIDT